MSIGEALAHNQTCVDDRGYSGVHLTCDIHFDSAHILLVNGRLHAYVFLKAHVSEGPSRDEANFLVKAQPFLQREDQALGERDYGQEGESSQQPALQVEEAINGKSIVSEDQLVLVEKQKIFQTPTKAAGWTEFLFSRHPFLFFLLLFQSSINLFFCVLLYSMC